MADEQDVRVARRARAEATAGELAAGAGDRMREYVAEWIASYDAALNGEYDAQRLVSDASRMASRMLGDAARLFVSGFDVLGVLAGMQAGPPPAKPPGPAGPGPPEPGPVEPEPSRRAPKG